MNGEWSTAEIADHPADVYNPPGASPPRFAVLHLHGVGLKTLRDRPAFTRLFDELRLACVCPHGEPLLVGRPDLRPNLIRKSRRKCTCSKTSLPYFKERWSQQSPAVGLLGVGMGGQGGLRLAFKQPDLFPVVAGIAPSIEYHELYGHGTPIDANV